MRGRWKNGIGILFSLSLLGLVLAWQPLDQFAVVLRQVVLWPVLLAFALTVPMVLLRTWQTSCLARLQGMQVGFGPLLGLQLAISFYGLFLPGVVAAGVLRWYRLARLGGDPQATLALVVFSRLLEIEMALLLGLLFWFLDPGAPGWPGLPGMFAALAAGVAVLRYLAFHPRAAAWTEVQLSAWWPERRLAGLRRRLIELLGVTGRYGSLTGRAWGILLLNILGSHALGLLSVVLVAGALGMEVGIATLGWARAILALALLLPITWAGIGLREATMAAALVAAGQPGPAAVALGLLLSLRVLLEALAGGLVELHARLTPTPHGER
jgi:uncharacterized membrane protein YbhN (UPF0104 family)